ncbi:MAG: hypothetical protein LBD85_01055 [Oscillospiraceae bacterium]|nr:hypothetical protein [Oscillospiraceae bacterium]
MSDQYDIAVFLMAALMSLVVIVVLTCAAFASLSKQLRALRFLNENLLENINGSEDITSAVNLLRAEKVYEPTLSAAVISAILAVIVMVFSQYAIRLAEESYALWATTSKPIAVGLSYTLAIIAAIAVITRSIEYAVKYSATHHQLGQLITELQLRRSYTDKIESSAKDVSRIIDAFVSNLVKIESSLEIAVGITAAQSENLSRALVNANEFADEFADRFTKSLDHTLSATEDKIAHIVDELAADWLISVTEQRFKDMLSIIENNVKTTQSIAIELQSLAKEVNSLADTYGKYDKSANAAADKLAKAADQVSAALTPPNTAMIDDVRELMRQTTSGLNHMFNEAITAIREESGKRGE